MMPNTPGNKVYNFVRLLQGHFKNIRSNHIDNSLISCGRAANELETNW